ncbi:hypothetical protein [Tolypothrix sp. PCC 7910]|uniref:hypothetical protein n=1 Tax=Tolypothrix sp. PCC 7910 TaxID=2099387 RepID=UPI001FCB6F30|nr:hypothetical protein [Tolypothrix sp. PCC 7910]
MQYKVLAKVGHTSAHNAKQKILQNIYVREIRLYLAAVCAFVTGDCPAQHDVKRGDRTPKRFSYWNNPLRP